MYDSGICWSHSFRFHQHMSGSGGLMFDALPLIYLVRVLTDSHVVGGFHNIVKFCTY